VRVTKQKKLNLTYKGTSGIGMRCLEMKTAMGMEMGMELGMGTGNATGWRLMHYESDMSWEVMQGV